MKSKKELKLIELLLSFNVFPASCVKDVVDYVRSLEMSRISKLMADIKNGTFGKNELGELFFPNGAFCRPESVESN